ncbi:MAG TPA: barstar family protein [Candidatus Limnocylindrales bacterium]|nr:barstar family protein [Candidatus Limnocylindrales bacterium]
MPSLLKLLTDNKRAGVYQTAIDADEIVAGAKTVGLDVFKIDLAGAHGKTDLLDRFAKVLRFPTHFGKNWDALNDCLTDLDWLSGQGLVLIVTGAKDFAKAHEEAFQTVFDVLDGAAAYWRERKKPFWVMIQSHAALTVEIPKIVSD